MTEFTYYVTDRKYATDENGLPLNLNKKQEQNGIYMWTWLEPDGMWRAQCWVPAALLHLTNGRRNFTIAKFPGHDERPAAYVAMKFKEELELNLMLFTEGAYELPPIPTTWALTSGEATGEIKLPHYVSPNSSDADHPSARVVKPKINRDDVLTAIWDHYISIKSSLSQSTISVLKKHRDDIAAAVLDVVTDKDQIGDAVKDQFAQYC